MADNHRDEREAMEPLAEADEQAQDLAPPADNLRRSTRQRRPPERLGTWVYFKIDTWACPFFFEGGSNVTVIMCSLYLDLEHSFY